MNIWAQKSALIQPRTDRLQLSPAVPVPRGGGAAHPCRPPAKSSPPLRSTIRAAGLLYFLPIEPLQHHFEKIVSSSIPATHFNTGILTLRDFKVPSPPSFHLPISKLGFNNFLHFLSVQYFRFTLSSVRSTL